MTGSFFMRRRDVLAGGLAAGTALSLTLSGPAQARRMPIKCVLVGDGAVGKTCAAISFTTGSFPGEYIPTVFDNYSVNLMHNGPAFLGIWDTAGAEDYDRLRPLNYPQTDVVILAYSIISPSSFDSVTSRWLPELRHHLPANTPIVLSGFKSDLRDNEHSDHFDYVERAAGVQLAATEGLDSYRECSALTRDGLQGLFHRAIDAARGIAEEPVNRRQQMLGDRVPIDRDRLRRPGGRRGPGN